MTAFQATFSDFKLVRGRKVAQFVFETPIEAADAALETLGGVPRPDQEAWVGIARIDPKKAAGDAPKPAGETKERRRFHDLPLSQQAAMRCNEPAFQRFLAETYGYPATDASVAAENVRELCTVQSRADILEGRPSGILWCQTESEYQAWLGRPSRHDHP